MFCIKIGTIVQGKSTKVCMCELCLYGGNFNDLKIYSDWQEGSHGGKKRKPKKRENF